MNCQTHLYRGQDPKLVTRRWFFQQCGVGLGAIALGQLFRESGWAGPGALNPLSAKQPDGRIPEARLLAEAAELRSLLR